MASEFWPGLRERGIYGAAFFRQPSYAMYMFQERFRNEGGKFFDSGTMKATINSPIGIKVFTEMRDENSFMPPGIEQWGFNENLSAFLQGRTAMTISWPPYGRWAAGYGADLEMLSWVPKSEIVGKVGYALPPGGIRNWRQVSRCRSPRDAMPTVLTGPPV